jgi:hypothetical protein
LGGGGVLQADIHVTCWEGKCVSNESTNGGVVFYGMNSLHTSPFPFLAKASVVWRRNKRFIFASKDKLNFKLNKSLFSRTISWPSRF